MSAVEASILKQVEFYFSNSNLPNDKFLRGLVQKEGEDRWVPIATISSFKKMKALSEDAAVILAAIKSSPSLLEVSEDGLKVRRKEPLPANVDTTAQTIYAKGFPSDYSMEQVAAFFQEQLKEGEALNCTRMRRMHGTKEFKGSVFVEFSSVECAVRVAALELKAPTPEAQPMVMQMKADYLARKKAEWEEKKAARKANKGKRKAEGAEGEEGSGKAEFKKEVHKDCILRVGDLPEECMREDIKALVEGAGCTVVFVEFNRGNEVGYVRLAPESEVKATAAVAKLVEDKAQLKDKLPALVVLEGEEEQAYWEKVWEMQQAKKSGGGRKGGKRQRR
jgi:lupus La protein